MPEANPDRPHGNSSTYGRESGKNSTAGISSSAFTPSPSTVMPGRSRHSSHAFFAAAANGMSTAACTAQKFWKNAAVTQSSSMPSSAGKNPSAVTSITPIHSSASSASPHRRLRTVSCRSDARKSVHTSFGTSRAILTVQRAMAARAAPKVTTGRQHSRNSTFSLTSCQNSRARVSPTHAAPVFSGASLATPGPSFK